MKKRTEILKDIKAGLERRLGNDLKNVILFGSHAWGKPTASSDYDLLIVLTQDYDWITERKISNFCYEIDLKYNIMTDTHIVSEYELQHTLKGYDPVFVNALQKGIYA